MRKYKEAADNYSLEPNNNSNMNTCLLKVVDIGLFVAAPDYAEMIKVVNSRSRSSKPLQIDTCKANSLLLVPRSSTSSPFCSSSPTMMPSVPLRPCSATSTTTLPSSRPDSRSSLRQLLQVSSNKISDYSPANGMPLPMIAINSTRSSRLTSGRQLC